MYCSQTASSCEVVAEEPNSVPYPLKMAVVSALGDQKIPLSRKLNYLTGLDEKSPLKMRCLTK